MTGAPPSHRPCPALLSRRRTGRVAPARRAGDSRGDSDERPYSGPRRNGPAPPRPGPAPTTPAIIVTEILAKTAGDDHFEYFEIHNTTGGPIDLAAQRFSFAYSYVDSDDTTRDVPLTVEGPVVVEAGATAVLWLSYATGNVDSFARTVDQFRAYHGVDAAIQVVRVTGQNGMANGGDRGIRVLQGDDLRSWSHYPAGSMGEDLAVHFRVPEESVDATTPESLTVLGLQSERSPGAVLPIALERPTTQPEPPVQGPASNWPIMITEIAPDNSGVDDFEFFEIHNTTADAIDLSGYSFAYSYVESDDRTRDVPLSVEEPTVIEPGETIAMWLSYSTTTVDSFARTVDESRSHWGASAETRVVRMEGQAGMANGGGRGIRVVHAADDAASWSYYPSGSVGVDLTAHFRIPGDIAARSMLLLDEATAATPGTIDEDAHGARAGDGARFRPAARPRGRDLAAAGDRGDARLHECRSIRRLRVRRGLQRDEGADRLRRLCRTAR